MRLSFLASTFFLLVTLSLQAQVLTIDSCYEKAKRNYPLIKQYQLIEQSSEYNISNAAKSYLPQLSLTAVGAYIEGFPTPAGSESSPDKAQFIGIAQLNQTIWDGGATRSQKEIIRASTEVQKAETDVAIYDIRQRINQIFFGILLMDEQAMLLNILTENLNRNLNAVKLSNEMGIAYSSDVDEVKVELLKTEQRFAEIKYAREGYVNMLSLLIGDQLDENVKLEKPQNAIVNDAASISRPELSLFQRQRNYSTAQSGIKKAGTMPKIGLLGAGIMIQPGFAFGEEKIKSFGIVGLSASWKTQSLYRSSNEKELTRINIERIQNKEETFLFNTRLQVAQERSDLAKQQTILEKDQQIIDLKITIKKAYELKYQNGMCTMNDLIQATNNENEARGNKAVHEAQLLMSIYSHKNTSGN